jgi:hypothetical protein
MNLEFISRANDRYTFAKTTSKTELHSQEYQEQLRNYLTCPRFVQIIGIKSPNQSVLDEPGVVLTGQVQCLLRPNPIILISQQM